MHQQTVPKRLTGQKLHTRRKDKYALKTSKGMNVNDLGVSHDDDAITSARERNVQTARIVQKPNACSNPKINDDKAETLTYLDVRLSARKKR